MSQRLVYFNGEYIPESQAKVSIYDSSLMFGDMVFEMTRSFNKKQFKLKEHIDRLLLGLKILRIKINVGANELERICLKTMEVNDPYFSNDDEHRLMIDITRGPLDIYKKVTDIHNGSNIIIADFPLRWTVSNMGHLFTDGINAVIPNQRAIPSRLLDPKIKNRSRLHYLMANIEVSRFRGKDNWAILLDDDGFVCEGTGDNVFIVKNQTVYTPEGRNILRGISRGYVINELCRELGIRCIEKNLEPFDFFEADEAFMTGTPFCMLPVTTLDGIKIGNGLPGSTFAKLLNKWSENVGVNIKEQIVNWNSEAKNESISSPYQFK